MSGERILIADDDDLIRRLARRVLTRAGFEVVEASDAEEALGCFERHGGAFRAVLLDLRLPPAGAADLLDGFRAARPALTIVVVSGAPPEPDQRAQLERADAHFLAKPFAVPALLELLGLSEKADQAR